MKIEPFKNYAWPTAEDTCSIADAKESNSPFNAYCDPDEKGPSDLTIYASPYLKVISAEPDEGPTLAVYLEACKNYRIYKGCVLKKTAHTHRLADFEQGAAPMTCEATLIASLADVHGSNYRALAEVFVV